MALTRRRSACPARQKVVLGLLVVLAYIFGQLEACWDRHLLGQNTDITSRLRVLFTALANPNQGQLVAVAVALVAVS